ncbi:hypothetical protein M9H77_00809 [Catharanthus roseus]|uniref:Uncharacterized protein n=1 Tax=Catharanthus roseus TaxID=4058 RepID=A0ACC0C3P5_CATRO|nr:hypothetical protein M9H77_00809 [Catharanthus roseus]
MICEEPNQVLKRSKLSVPITAPVMEVVQPCGLEIIGTWKTSETLSQTLTFFTLGMKSQNSHGGGQNRVMTLFVEELKLESELERLLFLEDDY